METAIAEGKRSFLTRGSRGASQAPPAGVTDAILNISSQNGVHFWILLISHFKTIKSKSCLGGLTLWPLSRTATGKLYTYRAYNIYMACDISTLICMFFSSNKILDISRPCPGPCHRAGSRAAYPMQPIDVPGNASIERGGAIGRLNPTKGNEFEEEDL